MFLQGSVCPQGGCLPQCMLGYTPLGADTPPQSRHPPEADTPGKQTPPGSRHPLGADTPWNRHPLEADTPWKQTPPRADTPQSRHPPEADTPLDETATAADYTHPTGMHSCFDLKWQEDSNISPHIVHQASYP